MLLGIFALHLDIFAPRNLCVLVCSSESLLCVSRMAPLLTVRVGDHLTAIHCYQLAEQWVRQGCHGGLPRHRDAPGPAGDAETAGQALTGRGRHRGGPHGHKKGSPRSSCGMPLVSLTASPASTSSEDKNAIACDSARSSCAMPLVSLTASPASTSSEDKYAIACGSTPVWPV